MRCCGVFLSTITLLALCPVVAADTRDVQEESAQTSGGPRNVWVGAQVAFNISGSDKFEDIFQSSAQMSLQAWKPKWLKDNPKLRFPFIGNVARFSPEATEEQNKQALQALVTTVEGVYIRFVPNYQFGDPQDYGLTLWGSTGWKLNATKSAMDDTIVDLHQWRSTVGFEVSIGDMKPSDNPLTVALELGFANFRNEPFAEAFPGKEGQVGTLELTTILPILKGLGFLGEGIWSSNDFPTLFRLGVVVAPAEVAGKLNDPSE